MICPFDTGRLYDTDPFGLLTVELHKLSSTPHKLSTDTGGGRWSEQRTFQRLGIVPAEPQHAAVFQ